MLCIKYIRIVVYYLTSVLLGSRARELVRRPFSAPGRFTARGLGTPNDIRTADLQITSFRSASLGRIDELP